MGLTALVVQAVYGLLILAFATSHVLWLSEVLLFLTGAALMIVFSTVTSLIQLIAPERDARPRDEHLHGRVPRRHAARQPGQRLPRHVIGAPTVIAINGVLLVVVAALFPRPQPRGEGASRERIHVMKITSDRDIMPVLELVTSSGLGSLLGMRHALEPDHLAAVSTLVTRERSGYKAALIGAWWGLGHTLSLLVVGAVLLVLRAEMTTARLGRVRVLRGADAHRPRLARRPSGRPSGHGRPGARPSARACRAHRHPGVPGARARRPLDARTPAAPRRRRSRPRRQRRAHRAGADDAADDGGADHLHFAVRTRIDAGDGGAVWLLGWPLARLGSHHAVARGISLAVGCVSIGLGLAWGYPFVIGLL